MAYQGTVPINLGSAAVGLTLQARLAPSGGAVGSPVTTGFREFSNGRYDWTGTFPDGFQGSVLIDDTAASGICATADPPAPPPVSAAANATAIMTDLLSGADFNTAGSFGKLVKDNLNATMTSRSSHTVADVGTQITSDHGSGSYIRNTEPPTAAAVAAAVNPVTLAPGAISDASFTVVADPAVVPTGVVGWVQAIAARLNIIRRVKVDKLAGTVVVYKANGTTPWFTNTYSASADVEDVSAAS